MPETGKPLPKSLENAAIALHNHARKPTDREGIDWVPWERLPEWSQAYYFEQVEIVIDNL